MRAGRIERREVPHEEGAWIDFRTLSGAELDEAEEIQGKKALTWIQGFDVNALMAGALERTAQEMGASAQQELGYDKDTLIHYGIHGCSECDPCTDESKRLLDAQTRNWAVSVIEEMNIRPLVRLNLSGNGSSAARSRQRSEAPTGFTPLD